MQKTKEAKSKPKNWRATCYLMPHRFLEMEYQLRINKKPIENILQENLVTASSKQTNCAASLIEAGNATGARYVPVLYAWMIRVTFIVLGSIRILLWLLSKLTIVLKVSPGFNRLAKTEVDEKTDVVIVHEVEYDEERDILSMKFKKQISRNLYQLLLLFLHAKRQGRYNDTERTAEENNKPYIHDCDSSFQVQNDDDSVVLKRRILDRVTYCEDNGKTHFSQNDASVKFHQAFGKPRQKMQLSHDHSGPQQNQGSDFTKSDLREAEAYVSTPQAVDASFRGMKTKPYVKKSSNDLLFCRNAAAFTGKPGKNLYPPPEDYKSAWLTNVSDIPQPYFDKSVIQQTYKDLFVYFVPEVQIPNIPDFEPLLSIIDQISRGRPPAPHVSMRYEMLRFCTLRSYPKEDKPYLIKLAEAGFYYASDGDGVVCYCCGIRRYNWTAADRPMEVHKKINPACKFLTKNLEVNIKNNYNGPFRSALMFIDSIPEPPESQEPPEVVNNELMPERNRTSTGRPQTALDSKQQLGINTAIPKHSQYATKAARVASYVGWPDAASHSPEELADAGFFYAGFEDHVQCFCCGIGLRHWTREDNTWIEHARWAKNCVFVKQKKGEDFIKLVQLKAQYSQNNASQASTDGTDENPENKIKLLLRQGDGLKFPPKNEKKRYRLGRLCFETKDILSLKFPEWIYDKIIDAYLEVLQSEKKNICCLPTWLLSGERNDDLLNQFAEVQISKFSWIFAPVHVNDNHWILLAADVRRKTFSILDSGNKTFNYPEVSGAWEKFASKHCPGTWQQVLMESALQMDNCSCGAFVMLNALAISSNVPTKNMTQADAVDMRKYVLSVLLAKASVVQG